MDADKALATQTSERPKRSQNIVRGFFTKYRKMLIVVLMLTMMLVMNGFSFAQSSISFDPSALIDQINVWVPVFLPILGIGLGITIAIALIEKVGSSILKAFKS